MKIIRKIMLSVGISIIIGLIIGYITSEKKYYYLPGEKPKTEITKKNYETYRDPTTDWGADYTINTIEENVYNVSNAIIFGLLTFGTLCIVFFIKSPKNSEQN